MKSTQETADPSSPDKGQEEEKGPLVVIPYVVGMSDNIRWVCRKFNIREVFKSGRTLCSMLTKVKKVLVNNSMWYIVSPAVVARSTLERPNGGWR